MPFWCVLQCDLDLSPTAPGETSKAARCLIASIETRTSHRQKTAEAHLYLFDSKRCSKEVRHQTKTLARLESYCKMLYA